MLRSVHSAKCIHLAPCFVMLIVGCSGGPADGYKGDHGTVTGKATLSGKPLPEGCQVLFISAKGGYTATGVIKADGKYSLVYNGKSNLPAVDYQVQLSPPIVKAATTPAADASKMAAQVNTKSTVPVVPEGPIPAKYSSTASSKLEYKVKSGKNTADFELSP